MPLVSLTVQWKPRWCCPLAKPTGSALSLVPVDDRVESSNHFCAEERRPVPEPVPESAIASVDGPRWAYESASEAQPGSYGVLTSLNPRGEGNQRGERGTHLHLHTHTHTKSPGTQKSLGPDACSRGGGGGGGGGGGDGGGGSGSSDISGSSGSYGGSCSCSRSDGSGSTSSSSTSRLAEAAAGVAVVVVAVVALVVAVNVVSTAVAVDIVIVAGMQSSAGAFWRS